MPGDRCDAVLPFLVLLIFTLLLSGSLVSFYQYSNSSSLKPIWIPLLLEAFPDFSMQQTRYCSSYCQEASDVLPGAISYVIPFLHLKSSPAFIGSHLLSNSKPIKHNLVAASKS